MAFYNLCLHGDTPGVNYLSMCEPAVIPGAILELLNFSAFLPLGHLMRECPHVYTLIRMSENFPPTLPGNRRKILASNLQNRCQIYGETFSVTIVNGF